jgi:hypothetical protein
MKEGAIKIYESRSVYTQIAVNGRRTETTKLASPRINMKDYNSGMVEGPRTKISFSKDLEAIDRGNSFLVIKKLALLFGSLKKLNFLFGHQFYFNYFH